jgi:hypothetical protein
MRRFELVGMSLIVVGLGGCIGEDGRGLFHYGDHQNIPSRDKLPPAPVQESTRVDSLGRQILAANPDIGVRPMFIAIGTPNVSAFHRGTTELYVSSGLVNKCATDAELAAVLCAELGKMVADAQPSGPARGPIDRAPPYAPRISGDNDADRTRLAEQAYHEQQNRRRPDAGPTAAPDANILAVSYLTKTGYTSDDMTRVGPLLQQAARDPVFERQLTNPRGMGFGNPSP